MSSRARTSVHAKAVRRRRSFVSRLVGTAALLAGVLSACTESPLPPLPDSERDEAGVYAAVLRDYVSILELADLEASRKSLLVGDHTAWWSDPPAPGEIARAPRVPEFIFEQRSSEFRAEWSGAREDFERQRVAQRPLPRVEIGTPIEWVERRTAEERHALMWGGFVEQHGHGVYLVTLSHIGFDPRGERALVLVGCAASATGAWSDFVGLERDASGWRVVETVTYEQS